MTHLVPTLLAAPVGWFNIDPAVVQQSLYLIPLLPMLGALVNGLLGTRLSKGNIALVACGSVAASFGLSILVFCCVASDGGVKVLFQEFYRWFHTPGFDVTFSYGVDRLSSILLLIITGVGLLIHIYSISYMHEDAGFWRFFAYLNLFVGMMLILVMGANLVVMFVGWEGVGLASYLLIGFWYEDDAKAFAGRKAFIVNRIGDFGFLIGIFIIISVFHTVDFFAADTREGAPAGMIATPLLDHVEDVARRAGIVKADSDDLPLKTSEVRSGPFGRSDGIPLHNAARPAPGQPQQQQWVEPPHPGWSYYAAITLACLMLFLGACGKSAQLPLYVWLPDAMAGPTPVSALIHAATMVTAGVYMLCRLSFLYAQSPDAMLVVALVGACTALFAAIIGTAQDDIKKVLAYSTVSQLGYMVLGAGVGGYWASSLHLLTHAFFKACLFLGAGAVMHGMMNETNIWKMGGLRKSMPWTAYTFLISTIAITGVIPLSGFFSKDAILDLAQHSHLPGGAATGYLLYGLGSIAAGCTAFYMFRAYFLTFEGERRTMRDHHPHESMLMNVPLAILAGLAILALVIGVPLPESLGGGPMHLTAWAEYLNPVFEPAQHVLAQRHPEEVEGYPILTWLIAIAIAWAGAGYAYVKYMAKPIAATDLGAERPLGNALVEWTRHKFYVDELYDAVIVNPLKEAAHFLWKVVDQLIIDTIFVRGSAFVTSLFAELVRGLQNGRVARYAAVMALSLAVLLFSSPLHQAFRTVTSWFGH